MGCLVMVALALPGLAAILVSSRSPGGALGTLVGASAGVLILVGLHVFMCVPDPVPPLFIVALAVFAVLGGISGLAGHYITVRLARRRAPTVDVLTLGQWSKRSAVWGLVVGVPVGFVVGLVCGLSEQEGMAGVAALLVLWPISGGLFTMLWAGASATMDWHDSTILPLRRALTTGDPATEREARTAELALEFRAARTAALTSAIVAVCLGLVLRLTLFVPD